MKIEYVNYYLPQKGSYEYYDFNEVENAIHLILYCALYHDLNQKSEVI